MASRTLCFLAYAGALSAGALGASALSACAGAAASHSEAAQSAAAQSAAAQSAAAQSAAPAAPTPPSAVAAFFEEHAGCDHACVQEGGQMTSLHLRSPTLLSSLTLPAGRAELWSVEWSQDGPEVGTALVLAVPSSGPVDTPTEEDPIDPIDLFPARVGGHVLIYLGDLQRSRELDNYEDERQPVGEVADLRLEGGVLRTSFEVFERVSYYVTFGCDDDPDGQEIDHGPQLGYRVEAFCAFSDTPAPDDSTCGRPCAGGDACAAGTCGVAGVRCRTVLGRRHLLAPGGFDTCEGHRPRVPSRDERRAEELTFTVESADAIRSGTHEPRSLDALTGVSPFETLCPTPSSLELCDEEQRARCEAEIRGPSSSEAQ